MMNTPLLTLDGLNQMPVGDGPAIADTVGQLLAGFIRRDADALLRVYAEDADWVNAFGSVKRGAAEIASYLRGLFADANFNDGRMIASPQSRLRRLSGEVVTVSTHLRIAGQGLVGGGAIPVRDNYSLRVLQKQADGRWLIVSEMYMDANTEQSYAAHS
jgi:uncharacterized protein (TIGR02246 family)